MYSYGIYYINPNFNNPQLGYVFRQLYVRQALQMLMDQPGMDLAIFRGYAYPTSGAIPTQPDNQWVPANQKANGGQGPYAFSVANATKLLTDHGWAMVNGVMTCQDPAKCGPNIKKGTQLTWTVEYATGQASVTNMAQNYKSDASKAGIKLNLVGKSFNTLIGESTPCQMGPKCSWAMLWFGGWAYNGPGFEPTGESLFYTGSGSNSGSYSDPQMDKLINLTHTDSSLATFHQYSTYAAQQLPFLWAPNTYGVQAVKSNLAGVTFNPLYTLLPEYWYFTK